MMNEKMTRSELLNAIKAETDKRLQKALDEMARTGEEYDAVEIQKMTGDNFISVQSIVGFMSKNVDCCSISNGGSETARCPRGSRIRQHEKRVTRTYVNIDNPNDVLTISHKVKTYELR